MLNWGRTGINQKNDKVNKRETQKSLGLIQFQSKMDFLVITDWC